MEIKSEPTYRIDLWLAGDLAAIAQACREYCYGNGACVTVQPCEFIYTGGQESGVRVGLVNYPRFPSEPRELRNKANELAHWLLRAAYQHSILLVADDETTWITRRDECQAAK